MRVNKLNTPKGVWYKDGRRDNKYWAAVNLAKPFVPYGFPPYCVRERNVKSFATKALRDEFLNKKNRARG